MLKKSHLIFSTLFLSHLAIATDDFSMLRNQYFQMLDLRVTSRYRNQIPNYSSRLTSIADLERQKVSDGTLMTEDERLRAGLIFIYNSLMMTNINIGLKSGALELNEIISEKQYSMTGTLEDELKSRALIARDDLKLAKLLRPNDKRIESWLASANRNVKDALTKNESEQEISKVLDAVSERPTFNLWTAILVLKEYDESSELFQRLTKLAKSFVDSPVDGCKAHPEDCQSGPLAPYNRQVAITELGDTFLRQGENLIEKDEAKAMEMLYYARGTYNKIGTTELMGWPEADNFEARKLYLESLITNKKRSGIVLSKQPQYLSLYSCSACHTRKESE